MLFQKNIWEGLELWFWKSNLGIPGRLRTLMIWASVRCSVFNKKKSRRGSWQSRRRPCCSGRRSLPSRPKVGGGEGVVGGTPLPLGGGVWASPRKSLVFGVSRWSLVHSESKFGINLWGKMSAKIECLIHLCPVSRVVSELPHCFSQIWRFLCE